MNFSWAELSSTLDRPKLWNVRLLIQTIYWQLHYTVQAVHALFLGCTVFGELLVYYATYLVANQLLYLNTSTI